MAERRSTFRKRFNQLNEAKVIVLFRSDQVVNYIGKYTYKNRPKTAAKSLSFKLRKKVLFIMIPFQAKHQLYFIF